MTDDADKERIARGIVTELITRAKTIGVPKHSEHDFRDAAKVFQLYFRTYYDSLTTEEQGYAAQLLSLLAQERDELHKEAILKNAALLSQRLHEHS